MPRHVTTRSSRAVLAAGLLALLSGVAGCTTEAAGVPSAASMTSRSTDAPTPGPTDGPARSSRSAAPASALTALAEVEVKGRAPRTGYARTQFGDPWVDTDRNGCDTRNDILARDLADETFRPGTQNCVVLTGTLADPYSGRTIPFQRGQDTSEAVQIDHVVALSDAWQKGAQGWDTGRRTAFANDPLNLLAVDGPLNQQKSDGDAATWLPPNRAYRCEYVARQVAVKVAYDLWMTAAERDAVAGVLDTCPDEPLPGGGDASTPATTTSWTSTPTPTTSGASPRTSTAPETQGAAVPAPGDVYYENCAAVRAAGAAPIRPGDLGWRGAFDRDDDGVGCE